MAEGGTGSREKALTSPADLGEIDPFAGPLVLNDNPAGDWLEEIQAKALIVSPNIRKFPELPIEFEDRKKRFAIRILSIDNEVDAVVCLGRDLLPVRFSSSSFESSRKLRSNSDVLALGLSISWFLDCVIVLSRSERSDLRVFEAQRKIELGRGRRLTRYVPTQRYVESVREVKKGNGVRPARHEVAGHIRQLPEGQRPSSQARQNAPAFLRRKMTATETYVVPHERGQAAARRDYVIALSEKSALAHAVALL